MLFVSYLQQCHSKSMSFSFQGPQLGLRLTWAGASTPRRWYNEIFQNVTQLVDLCLVCHIFKLVITDAPFTGAQKFQDICKELRTCSKLQDKF